MEYLIYLILGLILLSVFKKSSIKTPKTIRSRSNKKVKIIDRHENEEEIIFMIDVDETFLLTGTILKTASPWVKIIIKGYEDYVYEYNTLNFKWKNSYSPDLYEYQKAINKIIRDEWNASKEKYGWVIEKYKPQKKQAPVTANISTREISIKYELDGLKSLKEQIYIQGSGEQPYQVNLKKLSCTCPDFTKCRTDYPEGDIRRVCKHQAQAIINAKINTKITDDKKIQAIVRTSQSTGFHPFEKCIEVVFNEEISGPEKFYLFIEKNSDWISVVVFTQKSLIRNGYNLNEKRWAYGENPFPDGLKRKYVKAIHQALSISTGNTEPHYEY